jgi:hypothetical protein
MRHVHVHRNIAHGQTDNLTCVGCCGVLLSLLLQRILKVDYHIPSHIKLSPEGHDLLKKVLVADPGSRINIQQVRTSCWHMHYGEMVSCKSWHMHRVAFAILMQCDRGEWRLLHMCSHKKQRDGVRVLAQVVSAGDCCKYTSNQGIG